MIPLFPISSHFFPFPSYKERTAWATLPDETKTYCLEQARSISGQDWLALPAVRYMDFVRNGNRSRYESLYFKRRDDLFMLLMAECIQGDGAFMDDIINAVWLICEESTWVVPAHNGHIPPATELVDIERQPYIDLFAAETGSLLGWIYYFLRDALDETAPLVRRRIEIELERRIIKPYRENDFEWMGLSHNDPVNNWNPWINSNVLVVFLIFYTNAKRMFSDDGAPDNYTAVIHKSIDSINRFLAFYEPDGGCDEGPAYFNVAGASLLDFIEELAQVAPEAEALYAQPLIQNIARYISKVYIGNQYYVNFADAPPRVSADAALLARTGEKIRDSNLIGFGAFLMDNGFSRNASIPHTRTLYRVLTNLFYPMPQAAYTAPRVSWFDGIQVLCVRDKEGGLDGFFVAAKGGHNAESHNHNDIGNFILYRNGIPILVDAGVETYTKQTFSDDRYALWTMQSGYHNTPVINGYEQLPGRERCATDVTFQSDNDATEISMELKNAYPTAAGIHSYRRHIRFTHEDALVITDTYALDNCVEPLSLHFLCYAEPTLESGRIRLNEGVVMAYDDARFTAAAETIMLTDPKISADWEKNQLYRVILTARERLTADMVAVRLFSDKAV